MRIHLDVEIEISSLIAVDKFSTDDWFGWLTTAAPSEIKSVHVIGSARKANPDEKRWVVANAQWMSIAHDTSKDLPSTGLYRLHTHPLQVTRDQMIRMMQRRWRHVSNSAVRSYWTD